MSDLLFQYCPKIAVLSQDGSSVLLCRRQNEADFDGVFSLIGGKMEHADVSIVEALRREKNEEVGEDFQIEVMPHYTVNIFFVKKDGNRMILPHHFARHVSGEPVLSAEYSESRWIPLAELDEFEPKVTNVGHVVKLLCDAKKMMPREEFVLI